MVESDAQLTSEEIDLIEEGYTLKDLYDGGGWVVAEHSFDSKTGTALEFQAEIGCAGECFGCYGHPLKFAERQKGQTQIY